MDVSIIIPVYNAERWLEPCLQSVFDQTFTGKLQVSIFDDSSTDGSHQIIDLWRPRLEERGINVVVGGPRNGGGPRGVGFAKNRAIEQSSGKYLCFLDADDVMHNDRVQKQYEAALDNPNALIGSRFHREPEGSTIRYTKWANHISDEQLLTQVYTSHGPTIIMPTWFCSLETFHAAGPWDEQGKGMPEDLIFFLRHLELGGKVIRLPEDLLMYRYHTESATFSVNKDTIWNIRVRVIENRVLKHWEKFTIWNAGKQGRKLYRSLSEEVRAKVAAFCDVDEKKITKGFYVYEDSEDLTGGSFEQNLASLNLKEGIDFYHFN